MTQSWSTTLSALTFGDFIPDGLVFRRRESSTPQRQNVHKVRPVPIPLVIQTRSDVDAVELNEEESHLVLFEGRANQC